MSRLLVELWGGPADGRVVRVYDSTEEVHIPNETSGDTPPDPTIALRYVRDDSGRFRFQGTVQKGQTE